MRLPQLPSWREADAIFIVKDSKSELTKNALIGPPDLAIELVSPGYRATDCRVKFAEYEAGGVREYWIVDTTAGTIAAYRLVDGKYVDLVLEADGKLRSTVVEGWWLSASELFKEPPPYAVELMQALGVV